MSSFQRMTNQYVSWKWWQVNVHFNTVFLHKYQHILLFQEDDGVYSSLLRPLFLFFSVLQYTHTLYHCPLIGTVFSWGLYVLKELFSNVFMNEWIQCLFNFSLTLFLWLSDTTGVWLSARQSTYDWSVLASVVQDLSALLTLFLILTSLASVLCFGN